MSSCTDKACLQVTEQGELFRNGEPMGRHMMVRDPALYTFAPAGGLFEPSHTAGEKVKDGEVVGHIHFVEDVDHAPTELRYGKGGIIWMCAGPGRCRRGDVLAVVMSDYQDPSTT